VGATADNVMSRAVPTKPRRLPRTRFIARPPLQTKSS